MALSEYDDRDRDGRVLKVWDLMDFCLFGEEVGDFLSLLFTSC